VSILTPEGKLTDLEKLMQKALKEPEFRARVIKSPKAALTEAGIEASAEKIAALKASFESLKGLHAALEGKARAKGA
jgi:hypothetical protein